MNIRALFPSGIRDGLDSVGADALGVLVAGVHLDRRNARRIGWRGLRPCMGTGHAWTMRVVGRGGVYGLAFLGEEQDGACLRSRFSAFHFPDPEEAVVVRYHPDARGIAASADYFTLIREFPRREESGLFFLGFLNFAIRLDLEGGAFSLEAPARRCAVAVDGLPEHGVEEGGLASDVPALRLALPLLRLLALSAEWILEEDPRWTVARAQYPLPAFTADGAWGTMAGEMLPGAILRAAFGADLPPCPDQSAFRPFSGRAFAARETEREDFRPVLHVVSGFLGSGKTTFLAAWLSWLHNHDRHTAVLQNELGARSLDSFLLEHETLSESLDEGCVCCTLADSLRPAVRRLMAVLPTEQIILETTGLANPGAVRDALDELGDMVRPGLCVSLVDALGAEGILEPGGPSGLAGEQIRRADVLVCNKVDAVSAVRLTGIMDALGRLNPEASVFAASHGRIPFGELDRILERRFGPGSKAAPALRQRPARHVTHRDEGYSSLAFDLTRPLGEAELAGIVSLARERCPRIKGVINSVEENRPRIVQYVAGVLSLEEPLSPPGTARFLVFIGKNLDADFAASLARFDCLAKPS